MKAISAPCLCLFLVACANAPPPGDGEHDDFVTAAGAADAFGVEEGSCEAEAALEVANSASADTLTVTVGLRSVATRNLLAARERARLQTLEELDAVPWIGPVSFERILEYGRDQGFVADCERRRTDVEPGFWVTLNVSAGGDGFNPYNGDWTYDELEGGYTHGFEIDVTELPFRYSIGDFDARISEEGEVSLEYSYGDYDASARARARVPLDAAPGTSYAVSVAGGDHASGAWNVDATLELTLR